jgi:ribonuclease-3
LLSDAFEAVLGAVYLDQGLDAARQFLLPLLQSQLEMLSSEARSLDAKTRLQEWAQARYHETPSYVTVEETGPDHAKRFTVAVVIRGQVSGRGEGHNKQAAEQAAAAAALLAPVPGESEAGSPTPG